MLKEIAPETGTQIKGKILIVDDEAIIRDSLGKWFSSEGYMARTAASAREALEVIHQAEFDIALIDIRMPGMDGMALQSRLREAARLGFKHALLAREEPKSMEALQKLGLQAHFVRDVEEAFRELWPGA